MTTSGTVAQTKVTVEQLISHAFGRCGQLPSAIGGELLSRAREALYYLLADLGNDGINLWCMTKSVLNVVPNRVDYQLPVGTLDVTNSLYRTLWSLPGVPVQTADAVTVDVGGPEPVDNVTGRFTTGGTLSMVIEASIDGVVWHVLVENPEIEVAAGASFVTDLDSTMTAQFWRIRDISGTLLPMDNVRFRKVNTEITMAALNIDDYTNLPNKHYRGQRSLQYWFDKQIEPRVWVWPMSDKELDQIVIWSALQVQDAGRLTNDLAVPTRWYRSIQATLSHQVAFLVPANQLPQGRLGELKNDADEARLRAINGESDNSSFRIAPRIGSYTR